MSKTYDWYVVYVVSNLSEGYGSCISRLRTSKSPNLMMSDIESWGLGGKVISNIIPVNREPEK